MDRAEGLRGEAAEARTGTRMIVGATGQGMGKAEVEAEGQGGGHNGIGPVRRPAPP